jgi:hypothetical protein
MSTRRKYLQPLSLLLVFLLLETSLAGGQEAPPPAGGLTITIIEGSDAIMNVRQRVNREAIVQVDDENHKPVAGALVTFFAPSQGPSATFANGVQNTTLMTDQHGRVVLRGIKPNQTEGKYQIRVSASKDGRTGSATIAQTNLAIAAAAAAGGGISTKALIAILVAAGVAAGVGAGIALSGGSSKTAPAVGLQPGAPSVGAPH